MPGTLLIAPGKTSQTPTVATVSSPPLVLAAFSMARITSAAAHRASRRSGISSAPAWPARPFDDDAETGGRGNFCDDAERDALPFEQGALLDVEFEKRFVVAGWELDALRSPCTPALWRNSSSDWPSLSVSFWAASGESVPASNRLPRHPMPKRVGSSDVKTRSSIEFFGRNPASLQRANRFESSEDADHAIVFAGVGNRVDVRAGADRRSIGIGALPARKSISDGILAHGEPRFSQSAIIQARAFLSAAPNTTRVTTGGSASEIDARASISDDSRA